MSAETWQGHYGESAAFDQESPQYGGTAPIGPRKAGGLHKRKRMNLLAAGMCFFLPFFVFAAVYAAMSFSWHVNRPHLVHFIDAVGFIFVLVFAYMAYDAIWKRMNTDTEREPTWFVAMAISMTIAYTLAMVLGDYNFVTNLQPFYDLKHLNKYVGVDPAKTSGGQYMDAAEIAFATGSEIELSKAMSFMNDNVFCVAPIVNALAGPPASYDFWAVGLNCCDRGGRNFDCGDVQNPQAKSGLRLMHEGQREFYRLAIQQAESTHHIEASHPLFFHWTVDADQDTEDFRQDGVRYYLLGLFTELAFQLLFVVVTLAVDLK